jgi:HK97 family phage portal protein
MIKRQPGYLSLLWARVASAWGQKASKVGPMIARLMVGRPVWPERDYEKLAKEGYQQNPVGNACIALIAKAVADIPWCMYSGRGAKKVEVEEHEFFDMMERPSPLHDRVSFLQAVVTQYMISGNAYIERTEEKKFARMELYAHRADRMRIVPGKEGIPEAYEYQVGGDRRRFEVDPDGGAMPILHLKTVNPINDWYGQSPLDACAWAIDLHNGSSSHNMALLNNSGSPAGALVFEGHDDANTLSPERAESLLAQVRGEERGYDRSGSRMLLDGGKFNWLQFGLDMEKLQTLEGKNQAAREIAFTLGVPPMLLGIPGDNTYSNYQEARQAFYQETVIPLANMLARAFNHWFATTLGKGVYLEANIDDLDALQPSRTEHWERIEKSTVLSLNEKREALGYDTVDGGDEHYESAGKIPISMAMDVATADQDRLDRDQDRADEALKKKPKAGAKHMPAASVHSPDTV